MHEQPPDYSCFQKPTAPHRPPPQPIIIDYQKLGQCAMRGAQQYLENKAPSKTRDGLWHGATGKLRAQRLLQYLSWCGIEDPNAVGAHASDHRAVLNQDGLLALLLAVFGEEQGIVWGRSSRLAGLIANQLIRGEYQVDYCIGLSIMKDTLTSDVFSEPVLAKTKHDTSNLRYTVPDIEQAYCDRTKCTRCLLNQALSQVLQVSPEHVPAIRESMARLSKYLVEASVTIKPSDLFGNPEWISNPAPPI